MALCNYLQYYCSARIPEENMKLLQKSPDPPSQHAILEAIHTGIVWV